MLALERLVKCGWECSVERSIDGRQIQLQAKKCLTDGCEYSTPHMFTLPIVIPPLLSDELAIEAGWEEIRCEIVHKLTEKNKVSAHPNQDFVPDEDSNRLLLSILGFETRNNEVNGEQWFGVDRGRFEHIIVLTKTEWYNAVRNHGGRIQACNFYWGCMVQELLELKEIKE